MTSTPSTGAEWTPDLLATATSPCPVADADEYGQRLMRTMSADAYRAWLPHLAAYLGRGVPGQPVALTDAEMLNLADWYAIAEVDGPLYALSGAGMAETAAQAALGVEPGTEVRELASAHGWVAGPHRHNLTLGA